MTKSLVFLAATLISGIAIACPHNATQLMCPGDAVVDSGGYQGHVSAVNPFQHTVAINYGGAQSEVHSVESVALGMGCIEGYCVGDRAVDSGGYQGRISAVNPYNRTVAINYGGAQSEIHSLESVALGLGCVRGYCVSDAVVDSGGYQGHISAVNPYNGTVAINYGGAQSEVHSLESVSTAEYCVTYGDRERAYARYPQTPSGLYISAQLHFHLHR